VHSSKAVHIDNGEEFAMCNAGMLLGGPVWTDAAEVPTHARCRRKACASAYAVADTEAHERERRDAMITFTEDDIHTATVTYAEHVTGYSMRDGGRSYTCRCGWSASSHDAQQKAQTHRMREALDAVADSHDPNSDAHPDREDGSAER